MTDKSKNAASFDAADDIFGRMAESYDLLCDLFSLYAHRYWKSSLAKVIAATPGENLLDVAAGTGDIGLRVAKLLDASAHTRPNKHIVLGDLCSKMLAVAERKALRNGVECEYRELNAHDLDGVADESVDILSISFAMKICNRDDVLAAAHRVLKPGGRFFCLEAARIPNRLVHSAYLAYMRLCVPLIALWVTKGDRSAYDYLLRGVHDFPNQTQFAREIENAGFRDVTFDNLTFGIVALHSASK